MVEPYCIVVYGLDELTSAIARMLLLAGHAVAMHQPSPPVVLRRKMSFSDAWYDGAAVLDGVEARRADSDVDFLSGLRSRMYIPVLTHPLIDVIGRWPWDVVVDGRGMSAADKNIRNAAGLTIALGAGAFAGVDCDLVIETAGPDPGAIIREGRAKTELRPTESYECPIVATDSGVFETRRIIGETVAAGGLLGLVGDTQVLAPRAGRLRGLQRSPRFVRTGDIIAEIVEQPTAQVSGIGRIERLVARSVEFAIELDQQEAAVNIANMKW